MARNRALGSPYQIENVFEDFTTSFGVDAYMVGAVPLVVTLDPYAVNNDEVLIQDVTNEASAGTPIVINVSEGQTILNGYGESISIETSGNGVKLTYDYDLKGWVPVIVSSASGSGGDGITQLTRDVLAGPGTGSQPAEVVGILDNLLPSLSAGALTWSGSAWEFVESSDLVWRPGGTDSPGVVTTWDAVAAAIASTNILRVWVDSSIDSAVIPGSAGTVDCLGTTSLLSYNWGQLSMSINDIVEIQDGATLYRLREIADGLQVICDCVTTAALAFSTDDEDAFSLRTSANIQLGDDAAVGAIQLSDGHSLALYCEENVLIEADTGSFCTLTAGATLSWSTYNGLSLTGAALVTGPSGATVYFNHDSQTALPPFASWGFEGTVSERRLDLAAWAQPSAGTTGTRPVAPNLQTGQIYFDTTLQELIVWNGTEWVIPSTAEDYWADFGDGSDGTVTFDGSTNVVGFSLNSGTKTYTQERAVYFEDATLESDVTIVQGFALAYIHVRGTFDWEGTIRANGVSGVDQTGGTNTTGYLGGNGGDGGTNTNGTDGQTLGAGHATGGGGGSGGASPGTAGGPGSDGGPIFNGIRTSAVWLQGVGISTNLSGSGAVALGLFGGLGGGGGAGAATSGGSWIGGGGGAGAQVSGVFAFNITGSGTQEAIGGNGGNATNTAGGIGEAAGGGGGGGGTCLVVTSTTALDLNITQTIDGGTGGNGISGGSAGVDGGSGLAITISPG